jgi:hypothetical protein
MYQSLAACDWILPGSQGENGQAQVGVRGLTRQRTALLAKGEVAYPGESRGSPFNLTRHFPDPVTQRYRSTSTVRQKNRGWMRYSLGGVTDDIFYLADQFVRSACP